MTTTSTVTDAAVEAACRESYGEIWETSRADIAIRSARSAMRAALEAALPHLAPQPVVDREALAKVINDVAVATGLAKYFKSGGAEDPSDVEEFVAAVMELARPMPTREQIKEALGTPDGAQNMRSPEGRAHALEALYGEQADAVLALLTGSAK